MIRSVVAVALCCAASVAAFAGVPPQRLARAVTTAHHAAPVSRRGFGSAAGGAVLLSSFAAPAQAAPSAAAKEYVTIAQRCAQNRDYGGAVVAWKRVVDLDPTADTLSNLANAEVSADRLADALVHYDAAVAALSPTAVESVWVVRLNRGVTRLALGDAKGALEDLDVACASETAAAVGASATLQSNRGLALVRLERYAEAEAAFKVASKRTPAPVPWWLQWALVLFELRRDTEALALIRRVTQKYGDAPEVLTAFAALLELAEEPAGSKATAAEERAQLSPADRAKYSDPKFARDTLHWPPRVIGGLRS